jgi:hypothetical protein
MRHLALCLLSLGILIAAPAVAQTNGQTVTLTADAPVFVSPNANQTPLRVGKAGSVLRLIELNGDWCQVEFEDPQFGRRVGYVRRQFVRISAPERPPVSAPQPNPQRPPTTQPQGPPSGRLSRQRGDVAIGYAFLYDTTDTLTLPFGVVGSDAWRISPNVDFAIESQFSHANNVYGTILGANVWSLFGGIRAWGGSRYGKNVLAFGEIFGGLLTEKATAGPFSQTFTGFGIEPGFGLEVPFTQVVAFRPQFDLLIGHVDGATSYGPALNVNVVFRLFSGDRASRRME